MGTVPLFATPFAAVDTGADRHFNARLVSLCESQRPGAPSGDHGQRDFLDSDGATSGELKRLILGHASAVVAGLVDDTEEFARLHIQARGWCSIVQQSGHIPSQHFPGASWLAVYCAQAGEPDAGFKNAGVLRLYEKRLASIYRDASNSELKPPYRYGSHTWAPVPGWMALFPAHVAHEVSVVRSVTPLILVFAMIRFG